MGYPAVFSLRRLGFALLPPAPDRAAEQQDHGRNQAELFLCGHRAGNAGTKGPIGKAGVPNPAGSRDSWI